MTVRWPSLLRPLRALLMHQEANAAAISGNTPGPDKQSNLI